MIVTQVMTPVNHANDLSHIFNLLSPLSPGSKIDTSHFHLDGILLFLTKKFYEQKHFLRLTYHRRINNTFNFQRKLACNSWKHFYLDFFCSLLFDHSGNSGIRHGIQDKQKEGLLLFGLPARFFSYRVLCVYLYSCLCVWLLNLTAVRGNLKATKYS